MEICIVKCRIIIVELFLYISFFTPHYEIIHLNNSLTFSQYKNNINFSEYSSTIKAIALYMPKIRISFIYDSYRDFNYKRNLVEEKGNKNVVEEEEEENNQNFFDLDIFENQIELAKSHGIYGFGIYYYFNYYSSIKIVNEALDIIFDNKSLSFNYLLILKNDNDIINNSLKHLIKEEKKENKLVNFIEEINKYLLDERYIRINNAPIIGIYSLDNITYINNLIHLWRKKITDYGIEKLFILGALNTYNSSFISKNKDIDGYIYLQNYKNINNYQYDLKKVYSYHGLLYEDQFEPQNFIIFKTSSLPFKKENQTELEDINIFNDYSPYKFYLLNKLLINYTKYTYEEDYQFLFINSFNYFIDKEILEKEGYDSINLFSKALFNLPLSIKKYDLTNLQKIPLIAVQAHIFFVDLLETTMDRINNIPVKFDLYITTTSDEHKNIIEKYLKLNSRASNFEILVVENKGRDVLPFIKQMNKVYRKYKYFCHIHTKKTQIPVLGDNWRQYLYDNILGTKEIISEILSKFETNEKLGIIFPENYFILIHFTYEKSGGHFLIMNHLLREIFPSYQLDRIPNFPAGSMLWARVSAVYQIFDKLDYISYYCPKEGGQTYNTIMHAIERLWAVVAQINGYSYATNFKYY